MHSRRWRSHNPSMTRGDPAMVSQLSNLLLVYGYGLLGSSVDLQLDSLGEYLLAVEARC